MQRLIKQKQSYLLGGLALLFSLSLLGCSRSSADGDISSSNGTVNSILNGWFDEGHLTEGETEENELDRKKIQENVNNINNLIAGIAQVKQSNAQWLQLEKQEASQATVPEEPAAEPEAAPVEEDPEDPAGTEKDSSKDKNNKVDADKNEDSTASTGNALQDAKDSVKKRLDQQLQLLEEMQKRIQLITLIEDVKRQELTEEVTGLTDELNALTAQLNQATNKDQVNEVSAALSKKAIYGAHIAKIEGLLLALQIRYLSEKALPELFLNMEDFTNASENAGVNVADKQVALGSARQDTIGVREEILITEQIFNIIVPLDNSKKDDAAAGGAISGMGGGSAGPYDAYYSEALTRLENISGELQRIKNALVDFGS